MSSTQEKVLAAVVAGVTGLVVGYLASAAWGFAALVGVYLVMIADNVLDRLDALREQIDILSLSKDPN